MKIRYLFSRFNELMNVYMKDICWVVNIYYFIDWMFAFIIHGASISDYFTYAFHQKRYNARRKYITYRKHKKIQRICNDKNDIIYCRDKFQFNQKFKNFLGRSWLDLKSSSLNDFISFTKNKKEIFVKDINGFCGIGIQKYDLVKINIEELYEELTKKTEDNIHFLIEERINQTGELTKFHPWSVNTIRITTIYDNKKDQVHFMSAQLRIGNKKNFVDNFHAFGLGAEIDIKTGVISSVAYDKFDNKYIYHPVTQKQIVGFKIPFWNECKDYIKDIVKNIPTVRYVGWDVVIQEDGSFILIEGNDNADHDIQQTSNSGLWDQYKKILKELI